MRLSTPLVAALVVAAAFAAGCRKAAEPSAAAAIRVDNPELGVSILELSPDFTVDTNQGDSLILERTAAEDDGRVYVEVGPVQPDGVNLIHWVEAQPPDFEAKPDGTFLGSRKLRTPIGDAYTARGRYAGEAGEMEETRVLARHPGAPRLLIVRYLYRAGDDTEQRITQLLDLFAQIEASTPSQPAASG